VCACVYTGEMCVAVCCRVLQCVAVCCVRCDMRYIIFVYLNHLIR